MWENNDYRGKMIYFLPVHLPQLFLQLYNIVHAPAPFILSKVLQGLGKQQ